MSEKKIVGGPIGTVGSYELDLVDGNLLLDVKVADGPLQSELKTQVSAAPIWDLFADKIKAAIPGQIDDLILEAARAAIFGPRV